MTLHTRRGTRLSVWVDDGYGNLTRIEYDQVIARFMAGWREL